MGKAPSTRTSHALSRHRPRLLCILAPPPHGKAPPIRNSHAPSKRRPRLLCILASPPNLLIGPASYSAFWSRLLLWSFILPYTLHFGSASYSAFWPCLLLCILPQTPIRHFCPVSYSAFWSPPATLHFAPPPPPTPPPPPPPPHPTPIPHPCSAFWPCLLSYSAFGPASYSAFRPWLLLCILASTPSLHFVPASYSAFCPAPTCGSPSHPNKPRPS